MSKPTWYCVVETTLISEDHFPLKSTRRAAFPVQWINTSISRMAKRLGRKTWIRVQKKLNWLEVILDQVHGTRPAYLPPTHHRQAVLLSSCPIAWIISNIWSVKWGWQWWKIRHCRWPIGLLVEGWTWSSVAVSINLTKIDYVEMLVWGETWPLIPTS